MSQLYPTGTGERFRERTTMGSTSLRGARRSTARRRSRRAAGGPGDNFELLDGQTSTTVKIMWKLTIALRRGIRTAFHVCRSGQPQLMFRWYDNIVRFAHHALSLLRATHRSFLAAANIQATADEFAGAAVRAIAYVYNFVVDSLRFIMRELHNASLIGGEARAYTRTRMFIMRVYRKGVFVVSRLFTEQILRLRALALASTTTPVAANELLCCHVCRRTFDKTFHYLQHIRVHYRLNMYLCRACGQTFVQQNGLDYHEKKCCSYHTDSTRNMAPPAVTAVELCESCDCFHQHGEVLRNHVLRQHANMNIDLGINRTQLTRLEQLLMNFEQPP